MSSKEYLVQKKLKFLKNNYLENLLQIIVDYKNLVYGEQRFQLVDRPQTTPDIAPTTVMQSIDANSDIGKVSQQVSICTKCELSRTRTQTVFGYGDPESSLMIIGEAPGFDEDKQGFPFVGKAGQLLDKMLAAIDLKRDDVYICNVLKCRPPDNRNPKPEEIESCAPYLAKQIELIDPKIILTLGNFATKYILGVETGISRLRGKTYNKDGRTILPTYHPSALLQNPQLKRPAWHDLKYLKLLLQKVK